MEQEMKDSKNSVLIGRDANGADIRINADEFNSIVHEQLELLLNQDNRVIKDLMIKIDNCCEKAKKEFDNRIKILEEKIKPPKEKTCWINKIPAWAWILISSIGGAIIFILVMILFQKWLDFEVYYENSATTIVLAFVGILATFVVVSNYAQVKEIEHKFEQKIDDIKEQFYTKSEIDSNIKCVENTLKSEFIRKSDIKTIEYRVEMYKNMLDSYVVWNSEDENKEMSYLDLSMQALYYYNRINEIEHYSVDGITLFIKRLSSSNKIEISEAQKDAYLKIAHNYSGSDRGDLIKLINSFEK
jgi:uncharacterized membrane protein (DUF485 family)